MEKARLMDPKDCVNPKCKASLQIKAGGFICPYCNKSFCIRCFIAIPNGNGSTIKCPYSSCERKIAILPIKTSASPRLK